MKHPLHFDCSKYAVVMSAMRTYRNILPIPQRLLFDIAYNKVSKTNNLQLDGMEMNLIMKALRRRANMFFHIGKTYEANIYLELVNELEQEKQKFQQSYAEKFFLIKEKAASAGTLTATVH